jgi:hypothetical protein
MKKKKEKKRARTGERRGEFIAREWLVCARLQFAQTAEGRRVARASFVGEGLGFATAFGKAKSHNLPELRTGTLLCHRPPQMSNFLTILTMALQRSDSYVSCLSLLIT